MAAARSLRYSLPWRDLLAAGRPPIGFRSNQEITPPSNSNHLRDTTRDESSGDLIDNVVLRRLKAPIRRRETSYVHRGRQGKPFGRGQVRPLSPPTATGARCPT